MSAHRWIAIIVLAASVGTACGSDGDEVPKRPPIARPLDASSFANRPCDLLPSDQAARLGYRTPGYDHKADQADKGLVASCLRTPPESPSLDFDLYLQHDQLADQYAWSKGAFVGGTGEPYLEPLTIAGQPAAALGPSHQRPNSGCEIVVGLTDTQSLRVNATEQDSDGGRVDGGLGHGDGRACEYAIEVAEAIVRNLGG